MRSSSLPIQRVAWPNERADATYRDKASALPGGLNPGLGPLRGRVLKDMTWE